MRRILLSFFLSLLPLTVLADGKVFSTPAFPANVTIPDQQAMIHFANGVERLVIETRFTGAGTNFAWVVPLPGEPTIEKATTGLFPTLQFIYGPEIVHDITQYYIWLALLVAYILILRRLKVSFMAGFLITVSLFLFSPMFLSSLSAGGKSGPAASSDKLSILDRKTVGIFDTTTIASRDLEALGNWLRQNGFLVPANTLPVISNYVQSGWVFVAVKVNRDKPETETSTPHPLSFQFKTGKPVYPMQLTGLAGTPLNVALYFFGGTSARAPHFKVEKCIQRGIYHRLLTQWVGQNSMITKLTATLTPAEMTKDIWLEQAPFVEERNLLYSRHGALTTALNWGGAFIVTGVFFAWMLSRAIKSWKTKRLKITGFIFLAGLILSVGMYFSLPKIEVRTIKSSSFLHLKKLHQALYYAAYSQTDKSGQSLSEVRNLLEAFTSNPTNAVACGLQNWDNIFIGGRIREEDSPGNYLLRETDEGIELVWINGLAGERFQTIIWPK